MNSYEITRVDQAALYQAVQSLPKGDFSSIEVNLRYGFINPVPDLSTGDGEALRSFLNIYKKHGVTPGATRKISCEREQGGSFIFKPRIHLEHPGTGFDGMNNEVKKFQAGMLARNKAPEKIHLASKLDVGLEWIVEHTGSLREQGYDIANFSAKYATRGLLVRGRIYGDREKIWCEAYLDDTPQYLQKITNLGERLARKREKE